MKPTVRISNRLANKRKVEYVAEDQSDEEPPRKKQKIVKKSATVQKKPATTRKRQSEESEEKDFSTSDSSSPKDSDENMEDSSSHEESKYDDDDEEDWGVLIPRKNLNLPDLKSMALKKILASADTCAYQSLGEEEYTLPDELLLQIFTNLSRKRLHVVGLTCRQWLRLTNDQSLGWHLAYSTALKENSSLYLSENKGYPALLYALNFINILFHTKSTRMRYLPDCPKELNILVYVVHDFFEKILVNPLLSN